MPTHELPIAATESVSNPGDIVAQMHAAINAAFDELWANTRHWSGATAEELAKDYADGLSREHLFADKVFGATCEAARRSANDPVTLLFDIDETIVKKDLSTEAGEDIVRPAFPAVVEALDAAYPARVEIGLLTTRGQSHLDA